MAVIEHLRGTVAHPRRHQPRTATAQLQPGPEPGLPPIPHV